jgi:beta-mannosidase
MISIFLSHGIRRAVFIGLFFLSTDAAVFAGTGDSLSLSGVDWHIREAAASPVPPQLSGDDAGWIPARVPGNIQSDLETALRLQPLWYGAGDPQLYEVAKKDWWYRKEFKVPADFSGSRVRLVFDGVDYACDVWLNGKHLGGNTNMFRRFAFEVADLLKTGETNQLDVRIARMPEAMTPYIEGGDAKMSGFGTPWYFVVGMIKMQEALKDLKSPTNFAYDWGVNIWTLGIWKDVRLEAGGAAAIESLKIETPLSENFKRAQVKVRVAVNSLNPAGGKVILRVTGNGADCVSETPFSVAEGAGNVTGEVVLENPALWWPNGHGEQPLYNLDVTLADASGKLLHTRHTRFGVREIRWELTAGAPADFPEKYLPVVNGRRIRMLGSNLIPPDLLFARIPERAPHLLRLAKASGFTALRVWGGGVIFPEEIYDLADELGIMLTVEMPVANLQPKGDPELLGNVDVTIRNIISQISNHPSIIEYTGGNELGYGINGDYRFIKRLRQIFSEEDPTRMFRDEDPVAGGAHGPHLFEMGSDRVPEIPPIYSKWNGVLPWVLDSAGAAPKLQAGPMRYGEFGYQTPAHLEVWHREIPPPAQWPIDRENPILIRKNATHALSSYTWLGKPAIDALFGEAADLDFLLKAGQFIGAEGLRYAVDALRRRGPATGGMMTWDFNEPWPNGAGSFQVDYDGRPLMNHAFMRQAVAPLALSLRYESSLYNPRQGIKAELFLTSDADSPARGLRWTWTARDRRGTVIGSGLGTVNADPLQVRKLGDLAIQPPDLTAFGPVLVELQLRDANGKTLNERLHVFGLAGVKAPWRGLLDNHGRDSDDDAKLLTQIAETAAGPENLAFSGNGAAPAKAASERPESNHMAAGLNDGKYGNTSCWIATNPNASFEIDLGRVVEVGRFKLGRDRTGEFRDRPFDRLKIEVSIDAADWQTVFAQDGITKLEGFRAGAVAEIAVPAVPARFLRVAVNPENPASGIFAGIDEFEVYAPEKTNRVAAGQISFQNGQPELFRPVTRTSLQVAAGTPRSVGNEEVLELKVTNTGKMTALFCEPKPLLDYRTDLLVDNLYVSIPPGESRLVTLRAPHPAAGGLTLAQTGWRVGSWNADDVVIEPDESVLLAMGRHDRMCREFAGYPTLAPELNNNPARVAGRLPDAANVPLLLDTGRVVEFAFDVPRAAAKAGARLLLHSSDQSATGANIRAELNGRPFEVLVAPGYGLQKADPAHLARPETSTINIPAEILKPGENSLRITITGDGWLTWDSLDLLSD